MPLVEGCRIQDVLVATANDDNGNFRSNLVEILAVGETLLLQLGLMPVGICNHNVTRLGFFRPRADAIQQVFERTRVEEVHARTAAGVMQVVILKPGHDGLSAGIEDSGGGPAQLSNLRCCTHRREFSVRDGDPFGRRELGIDGVDLCIHNDHIGRFGLCIYSASRHNKPDEHRNHPKYETTHWDSFYPKFLTIFASTFRTETLIQTEPASAGCWWPTVGLRVDRPGTLRWHS